jgi:hypothetical protein
MAVCHCFIGSIEVDLNPTKDELAAWIGTAVVCCDMSGVIADRIIRALSTEDIVYVHDELIALIDDMHKAHIVADEEFSKLSAPQDPMLSHQQQETSDRG